MQNRNNSFNNFILILFLSFLLPIIAGFQFPVNERGESPAGKEQENRFFTLDFENGNTGLGEFKQHFFTTFPHNDPTLGDVVYDKAKWLNKDMLEVKKNEGLYSYVKYRDDEKGYDSFRYTSKSFYNLNDETKRLLFVFKGKLPSSKGMWPAWWLNGCSEDPWIYKDEKPALDDEDLNRYSGVGNFYNTPSSVNATDWPSGGEIDLIENINGEKVIHNTIHTCPQMCDSEWNGSGEIINCANPKPGDPNSGCSGRKYEVESPEGTFACLLEKKTISFYYWAPGEDVRAESGPLSSEPVTEMWDEKYLKNRVVLLETDVECDSEKHQAWQCENCDAANTCTFKNLKMIFNVTICGVWAGNKFDSTDKAFENCKEYVRTVGKEDISGQSMRIDYVSVKGL